MQVSISFTELTYLIQKETGQSVRLAYKSSNEVVVSYKVSVNTRLFGQISKQLQTCVKLLNVYTDKVDFQLDAGMLNSVLYFASSFLLNKMPPGLLESFSNGRGTLRLSAIPQLKPVLERLEIESVWLDSINFHLGARTK